MHNHTDANDEMQGHVQKIRDNYDTTDVQAIMGRFYSAVSWRNEE